MKLKSIKIKLLFISLFVGLLPMVVFGVLTIRRSQTDLEKEISNKLLLLAEAKEGQVFAYLDSIESRTIDFSSDGFIEDSAKEIVSGSAGAVEALSAHLIENKKSLDKTLVGIAIMNLDGKIIAATDIREIGEDDSDDEYFIKGKEGVYVIELRKEEHFGLRDPIAVAAPLTDRVTKKPFGVIVNYFDPKKIESVLSGKFQLEKDAITQEAGRAKTLEVYIVDREKKMFVHPVAPGGHAHSAGMINDTLPVQKCLGDQEETTATYSNYAGEEVLGASMCILDKGWTLVAEMSTKEAFSPIAAMRFRLGLVSALFAIFAPLIGFAAANRIVVRPIRKLHEAAEIVAKGDLNYRVNIKTEDEIEQLGEAFNGMAVQLKKSYAAIEERARAEFEEKAKLKTLLESIGDGVVAIDRFFNITSWNKSATGLTGWSREEALGKPMREVLRFVRESDRKENIVFIEEAMLYGEQKSMENNTFLIRKDGAEIPVGDSAAPLFDSSGKISGAIIVFRDVSKEREAERVREEMIFQTVHDLRAPATAIKGAAELYIDPEYLARNPEGLREAKNLIEQANTRMLNLINSLLEGARSKAGVAKSDRLALPNIVQEVLKEFAPTAARRGVKIEYVPPQDLPQVSANAERLKEAFSNLIDNAIKYNKDGGTVTITHQKEGSFIRTVVEDTGIGISAENLPKLFTPYFRANTERQIQGTGLGLYIVKKCVEGAGGRIAADSKIGEGATFTVFLPVADALSS